jgi:hypothetical protein
MAPKVAAGVLSVDCRPIRDIGNSIGISLKKTALEELGVVDENGDVVDESECRVVITDDGKITITLPDHLVDDRARKELVADGRGD